MKDYPEVHQEGYLSVEQTLDIGMKECCFGIQVSSDGRVWICINGQAFLRFKPFLKSETNQLSNVDTKNEGGKHAIT